MEMERSVFPTFWGLLEKFLSLSLQRTHSTFGNTPESAQNVFIPLGKNHCFLEMKCGDGEVCFSLLLGTFGILVEILVAILAENSLDIRKYTRKCSECVHTLGQEPLFFGDEMLTLCRPHLLS